MAYGKCCSFRKKCKIWRLGTRKQSREYLKNETGIQLADQNQDPRIIVEKSLKSSIGSSESKNDNLDKGIEGETVQQKSHEGAVRVQKSFLQNFKPLGSAFFTLQLPGKWNQPGSCSFFPDSDFSNLRQSILQRGNSLLSLFLQISSFP